MEHSNQKAKHSKPHPLFKKALLVFISILIPFLLIELSFRIINSYWYYGEKIKNRVSFDRYDPLLGWSGIPGSKGWIYTKSSRFYFENNSLGFRDIEHDMSSIKPAIVFLGASYGWGYNIRTNKMFVNLLRDRLSKYEIFNISNVCYGTDQDLLTFESWQDKYRGQLKLVILVFSYADVERNGSSMQCQRGKPKFDIANDKLLLTGVPVPKTAEWQNKNEAPVSELSPPEDKREIPVPEMFEHQTYAKRLKASIKKYSFTHNLFMRYTSVTHYSSIQVSSSITHLTHMMQA